MVSTRSGARTRPSPERRDVEPEPPQPHPEDCAVAAGAPDAPPQDHQDAESSSDSGDGDAAEAGDSGSVGQADDSYGSGDDAAPADNDTEPQEVGGVKSVSEDGDGVDHGDDVADAAAAANERSSSPLAVASGSEAWDVFSGAAAEQPGLFMARSATATRACRVLLKRLYDEQSMVEQGGEAARRKKKRARSRAPLGPLASIDVGEIFEAEQVWEELALRNRPLRPFLEREVLRAARRDTAKGVYGGEGGAGVDGADVADVADEEGGGGVEEAEMEEADLKERSSDVGESGSEVGSGGEDEDENIDVVPRSSKKVRFSVDNGAAGIEKERLEDDASAGTSGDFEDGFFSLADMEAFGEEAEELAADGKLMADSDEETGDGAHSDEEEEDGDLLGMSLRGKLKGMSSQTGERIRYEDFFDKPGGEKSAGGSTSVETERAVRRATMFDDASSDGEEDEEGGAKTPLEVEREKLRDSIAALEDANVSKKPWQLRGEVDAHGRPMNSLLESEFEHDIVARPRVAPTAAASASIEDIIRQRIFDGLFDDVVRKLPADYEEARRKKQREPLPDISQDKPEEGLADLYEREYAEEREKVSKASEAASHITVREVDPEDNPEQAEVNRLFKRLSNKLDALASLHYTPAPPKMPAEMEVKPNVPALNAEEAIPEAVSDAALLAPREVHTATAKDLQGEVETDKLERRTRRRTKKRHISNDNKRKEGEKRLGEMADPALAEQRRAERTLQRPGKMLQAVANPNDRNKSKKKRGASIRSLEDVGSRTGDFAKSTRFFTQLQQTVQQDLAGKKSNMGARELSNGRTAASLKL